MRNTKYDLYVKVFYRVLMLMLLFASCVIIFVWTYLFWWVFSLDSFAKLAVARCIRSIKECWERILSCRPTQVEFIQWVETCTQTLNIHKIRTENTCKRNIDMNTQSQKDESKFDMKESLICKNVWKHELKHTNHANIQVCK